MKTVVEMEPAGDFLKSCFQKRSENRIARLDCTGATGFHVSPRRGTPKEAQNYVKSTQIEGTSFFNENAKHKK